MTIGLTEGGCKALVHLLPTCGGTQNRTMLKAAELLEASDSDDFYEALGPFGQALLREDRKAPGKELEPLNELVKTALSTTGVVDLESVILHFSGYEHTHKFDSVPTIVAREIPSGLQSFAHTLIPLSMVNGCYYYDNDPAYVQLKGLTQFGPSQGTPYAHLGGLVWFEDGGLSVRVLASQLEDGLATSISGLSEIDYSQAPKLQDSTRSAKKELGL